MFRIIKVLDSKARLVLGLREYLIWRGSDGSNKDESFQDIMGSEHPNTPRFSIVIASWNGLRHLQPCVGSLLPQMTPLWELVVVDNGSTDGTCEYVESLHEAGIRRIALHSNLGFAEANNIGVRETLGKWIFLLNNDTVADTELLRALEKCTVEFPQYQLFACRLIRMADGKIDSAGLHFRRRVFAEQINRGAAVSIETPREVFGASGGAMLFRRDIVDDIGLFNPDYFAYQEDVDFAVRARLAGYRCLYLPSATVYHKAGGTSSTNPSLYTYYNQRNLELVLQNFPRRLLWKYLPLRIVSGVRQVLRFAPHGDAITVIRAKFAAMAMIWRSDRDEIKQRVSTRCFDDFLRDRFPAGRQANIPQKVSESLSVE